MLLVSLLLVVFVLSVVSVSAFVPSVPATTQASASSSRGSDSCNRRTCEGCSSSVSLKNGGRMARGRGSLRSAGIDLIPVLKEINEGWGGVGAVVGGVVSEAIQSMNAVKASQAAAGMVGGSVGVVGTLIAIVNEKRKAKEKVRCNYCLGTGSLPCAQCLGSGRLSVKDKETGTVMQVNCPGCLGTTKRTCINCHGDGRTTPRFLDRSASRDPEDELDDYGAG